jgi:hypothetical protein
MPSDVLFDNIFLCSDSADMIATRPTIPVSAIMIKHQAGCLCFEDFDSFADADSWRDFDKQMQMIFVVYPFVYCHFSGMDSFLDNIVRDPEGLSVFESSRVREFNRMNYKI